MRLDLSMSTKQRVGSLSSVAPTVHGLHELDAGRYEGSLAIIMSTAHVHSLIRIRKEELEAVVLALVCCDIQWCLSIY